ncbi:MAG TPA: hypothetical protein VFR07_06055 [Mycobacteriales bacterium]|jgi:hypothetical protein|nr:hypothetical protein [Mycobacteriales bacterium]
MKRLYGAGPLHLLALLACFALAGAAAQRVGQDPLRLRYAVWFIGAALAHDLLLFPLYALLDRSLGSLVRRRRVPDLGSVNYVRVPALLSGLLLLVFAPVILQRSEGAYGAASGLDQDPYLGRWLAVSGVLFLASAVLYALRGRRA